MLARLYYNKSDKRYINKSLTLINDISIELKSDTSIINPTLILSYNSEVMQANYIYIPELDRYYYIDNIIASTQKLIVECSVDVLMSWRSQIDNMDVIVERSENVYNLYLPDEKFKLYNYPLIQTKKFTPTTTTQFNMNTTQFVLACAGT